MGSSWNFPARASPSYEVSKPSRAELGHFNFRAGNELNFFKALNKNYIQIFKRSCQNAPLCTGLVTCFVTGLVTGLINDLTT